MAETMAPSPEKDKQYFDLLRHFLLGQFGTRGEFQTAHNDVLDQMDNYAAGVNERSAYHRQILNDRSIEMDVRNTLYNSQLNLPVAIKHNHEEWLAYRFTINAALEAVNIHLDCGALLATEFINISDAWDQFWYYEEETDTYSYGDGQKLLQYLEDIKYHENRRQFLEQKFLAGRDEIAILFEEEPIWLGFQ